MTVGLDATRWRQLAQVNETVNRLPYRVDLERYGRPEFWTEIDAAGGDCEDFALGKRRRLRELGWPEESLRLATCTYHGDGHAVLTVDTDAGVWVLDNRYTDPQPWAVLPYKWIERQAATGLGWVTIPATT